MECTHSRLSKVVFRILCLRCFFYWCWNSIDLFDFDLCYSYYYNCCNSLNFFECFSLCLL